MYFTPRKMRIGAHVVLSLLLAATWQVAAQTASSYESAFLNYAQVTKGYDTQRMSEYMHPEGLKRFRTVIEAALRGPKKEQAAEALLPLFSVSSAADFARLTDLEAYKRMNDTIAKSSPGLVEMMSTSTFEIVGSYVKDGVAYVTYSLGVTVDGKPISSQVVQTLKEYDGKWLLLLPSTAERAVARIEARFN
jgi:hypothetical protein